MSQQVTTAEAELREAIAAVLELPADQLDDHANLIQLGMDSIAMMRLAGRWRRSGLEIGFADLAAEPTLSAWRDLLALQQAGMDASGEPAQSGESDGSEPFELALMQHAYWVGRAHGQRLGGVAAHFYNEFDGEHLDPARLETAVRAVIARHGMLRAQILDDGRQRILSQSPWPGLRVHDLRALPADEAERELLELRRRLSHRTMDIGSGEVFDVQLSLLPGEIRAGGTRVHVNLDMIAADAQSLRVLLGDLARLYDRPDDPLPPPAYSYPRYLADRAAARSAPARAEALRRDQEYWRDRLAGLPAAPRLPVASHDAEIGATTVVRRHHWLDADRMRRFEQMCRPHGLTPAMAMAAVFAETLTAWSDEPAFLLNLPLFDRDQSHADVASLVGDFTSSVLLEWDGAAPGSLAERAARLQRRFHADAAHSSYSGVEVLRDLSRLHGEQVLAPVVYTSALGLGELFSADVRAHFGEPSWIISQGPQVWLDAQVTELNGGVLVNWDAREDAFAPGVLDAMFDACTGLIERLLAAPEAWSAPVPPLLAPGQLKARAAANDTAGPRTGACLHQGFFARARTAPDAPALLWGQESVTTYGELAGRALRVAGHLRERGVRRGDLVAVSLPKGPGQVAAVLGVLAAGAAYLPLGVDQPVLRRERILRQAGVRLVLDEPDEPARAAPLAEPVAGDDTDLAYVIYTSGSTGEPKGVEITHAAAMNTVDDLNDRFGVGPGDRTLAVSALDFDLSVYDLFGPLSAGGAVVCVDEPRRRDAAAWVELLRRHRVTVLNCVPALLDMMLTAADDAGVQAEALRVVLLGGDWVTLDLPGRLARRAPHCRFTALGGTTETAIHSTICEVTGPVPATWTSVPYGTPLRNVSCRVVDPLGRDRPDWVPGELWIGGAGVARGYRGDPARTAEKFLELDGVRWYRTGDRARYWPDGSLEFLGRADHQVKVRGHRIELGEIEAALTSCPGVAQAVAVVTGTKGLAAAVTVADEAGPDAARVRDHLAERLPAAMVPDRIAVLERLPLTPNGKVDRRALGELLLARDVAGAGPATPPRGEVERRVAAVWSELLDVGEVGREHGFFRLGGDSLLATRMVGRLRAAGLSGVSLAELFARPALADFAATLRLGESAGPAAALVPDPEHRHEPFGPTEVQRAYWLGRREGFTLGGVGCHFYREYDVVDLDVTRLEAAVNTLIGRHEMLRAVFDENGDQRILPEVPRFTISVVDAGDDGEAARDELRRTASHRVFDPSVWPLFSIGAVRSGERTRLAIGIDNIVLDALSILIFYAELGALYADPDAELPPASMSFRDYVLGTRPEPRALAAAQRYWAGRLPELPPAPLLPLAADPADVTRPHFTRYEGRIDARRWQTINERAREHGITASAVLLAAFAEVLGRWSTRPDLTLNVTLFDRKEVHPDVNNVLGDFTSLTPVAYQPEPGETWSARVRRVQEQMGAALDHREVSTVWVLRELARLTGEPEVSMPVVFTSALGVPGGTAAPAGGPFSEQVFGVSQTPQVWLDHQVVEAGGGVAVNWDVVEELFHDGVVAAMFGAYLRLLEWLGEGEWARPVPDLLPARQREVRAAANATAGPLPDGLLHTAFFEHAARRPDRVALLSGDSAMTYGEVAEGALRLAALLGRHGVRRGEPVAVHLPKGPGQVVAVLGVLAAGAAYVPIGVDQPQARRDRIRRLAGVRLVVTDGVRQAAAGWSGGWEPIDVEDATAVPPAALAEVSPDDPAYVIFTSGSTGDPKGVEITHRAALNTVEDVNDRFGVGPDDRVLAVSALDFDLSVYDVFGLLSAGGAVVVCEEEARGDARRWLEVVAAHQVTIWNTVPALLDMLLTVGGEAAPPRTLRLALVSGDWVGLDLPGRVEAQYPGCRFVALGGATEAAIWSNAHEVRQVEPGWRSVPYGRPLRNQRFRVVDGHGRDCPDWVAGELWIGGAGVATGYRGAPDLTARQFVEWGGERWYRTGDLGRYWPDGTLEFLGRADQQVKIRGHRIELGEIEATLRDYPGAGPAIAAVTGEGSARRLVAALVPGALDDDEEPATVTEPSAGILAFRSQARETESATVEAVLTRLLDLPSADAAPWSFTDLAARLDLAERPAPVVRLWLRWLAERKILVEADGTFAAGPRLAAAVNGPWPEGDTGALYAAQAGTGDGAGSDVAGYARLVERAGRRLVERLDDYRRILSGDVDPAVVLDDDVLAPASLSDNDPGSGAALAELAGALAELAEAAGRPLEVAEIDGRDGRIAARLLGALSSDQVRYTLLDPSAAMVAAAGERLAALPHHTACHRLPGEYVPDELRHRFDVVLAYNVLHRQPDPAHGPALVALLARRGGTLLAVERTELTPIALMTAGLLDGGYAGFDRERRQAGTPMLSGAQWAGLIARAGLRDVSCHPVGSSFLNVLRARRPATATDLDTARIREYAATRLPAYMVPERVEILPRLPLSPNGKVDRAALARLAAGQDAGADPAEAPKGELEQAVAAMWTDLLGVPAVGRDQSFFELGGDSLLATRFLEAARRRFDVALPLRRLFAAPTLAEVAAELTAGLVAGPSPQDMAEGTAGGVGAAGDGAVDVGGDEVEEGAI
ncbi:amino acid adenylation domain-containing protein [Nonomuraea sp. H19]|uniref:amino acid adenylation domain-containing protein n=1 Tax=Nonomuraea sp. H19 TaxID=3452206 RepID=UPI003F88C9B8